MAYCEFLHHVFSKLKSHMSCFDADLCMTGYDLNPFCDMAGLQQEGHPCEPGPAQCFFPRGCFSLPLFGLPSFLEGHALGFYELSRDNLFWNSLYISKIELNKTECQLSDDPHKQLESGMISISQRVKRHCLLWVLALNPKELKCPDPDGTKYFPALRPQHANRKNSMEGLTGLWILQILVLDVAGLVFCLRRNVIPFFPAVQ